MIFVPASTAMLAVGFFNGANDVAKSIAALVGSGVRRYRTAIPGGSGWTFAGGACAALAAQGFKVTETPAQKVTALAYSLFRSLA